ncbi:LysR family transcriptional regulator [Streptomyces javensis]|uniref:helix-turn-helix domain-containing protein n=1 Tax=Streptomyces javensis TaxID=114698 RepID=UPI0033F73859
MFVAIADAGSLSRGAARLQTDQPALSRALRRLERMGEGAGPYGPVAEGVGPRLEVGGPADTTTRSVQVSVGLVERA